MNKVGFVGMGNMAQAMAEGFLKSGKLPQEAVLAYAPHKEKLYQNGTRIGFLPVDTLEELIHQSEIIIIACKPYQISEVLAEGKDGLTGKALLSIAAGWVYKDFYAILGDAVRIQCIMPNTPAMVGEGVMLFEAAHSLKEQERSMVLDWFSALGMVEELPTELMGIGGAVAGCGPAFMDLIMEAYADAAVQYGIQRDLAYRLISQTMRGSAKLQQVTGSHPGVLKDAVCSPKGTTIRGVHALEHSGLRAACMDSIDAIMQERSFSH
ncbi:MAG: pyrroline-5-carboxylate reductase [Bacteroides sp.]|nr:pyrroline-5-carboxylate reductase [Bacteroides sp.]MCM1550986.1 pyrroline-5-carboxylate reductase [Clostridium sp.]